MLGKDKVPPYLSGKNAGEGVKRLSMINFAFKIDPDSGAKCREQ